MTDNRMQHLQRTAEKGHLSSGFKRITLSCCALGFLVLGACQIALNAQQPGLDTITSVANSRLEPNAPAAIVLPAAKKASGVTNAANAFLATLSEKQRLVAQTELTPRLVARWSNLPGGSELRNGIFFRDLNQAQVTAALKVARLALGEEGFTRFQELRAADEVLAKSTGGAPNGNYSATIYSIAFLGKPSKSSPWLLQLGGHHIAFNIYYKGATGTATPYYLGVRPNIWKDAEGKTHEPLAPMRSAMRDLTNSLSTQQLKQARLDARFSDVYVGPGKDARFPTKSEGVAVSTLSDSAKKLVKQAIAAWTGDSVQGAQYQKLYSQELEQTKIAYSGGTALKETGDYVRIDGPHVWIEFSVQSSDHYHTIWRDRKTDYGAEFSF